MPKASKTLYAIILLLTLVTVMIIAVPCSQDSKILDVSKQNETKIAWEYINYRLPESLKPESYDIFFQLDSDGKNFDGRVTITAQVVETTKEIKLHRGSNLTVTMVSISVHAGKESRPINSSYNKRTEIETYDLAEALQKGSKIDLSLTYNGPLGDDMLGFYRSTYVDENGKERWVAATQFETKYARRAFPCFDEPAWKANFTISISKSNFPKGYHCLSNMPLSTKSTDELCVFEKSVPMSTYLVAFVISDFKNKTKSFVSVWTRPELLKQADYAVDIALKSMLVLDKTLREKYPIKKMDLVAVPDFIEYAGAMENYGILTFREATLLYDEDHTTNVAQQKIASVVVHECSHMWFGNLVTPSSWRFIWLSEAFATYYQYMVTARCENTWQMEEQFVIEQHQLAMSRDASEYYKLISRSVSTQSNVEENGGSLIYIKGASILRMIEKTFGSEVFDSALRKYLQQNKFKNVTPKDLWKALQREIDEKLEDDKYRINVTECMKSWTEKDGFPYVKVDMKQDHITLTQKRFLLYNSTEANDKTIWHIPITWISSASEKPPSKLEFWLNQTEITVEYESNEIEWQIFNVNSTGFYRVLYDNESWKKIVHVLKKGDISKIPVLNRAAIVDDLLNFARAEIVSYDIALSALQYLKRETEYVPFKSAFMSLDYLINKFAASPDYKLFKEYVISLYSNIYKKLTYDDSKTDGHLDILLRQKINQVACNFDVYDCVARSKKYFHIWKNDKKPIPKNQRPAAYCAAIKYGSDEDWEFLYEEYKNSRVTTEQLTILDALGCTKNTSKLEKYLLNALNTNYTKSLIHKQDVSTTFSAVYSNLEGAEYILEFIEKHFKAIEQYYKSYDEIGRIVSGVLKRYPIKKFIDRVKQMMSSNPNHFKTVKGFMRRSINLANFELKWFNKHSSIIIDWIRKKTEENTSHYRLPSNVVPKSYSINLTPKFEPDFIFEGRVEIEAKIQVATKKIVLHSDQLKIDEKNLFISSYGEKVEIYHVINTFYEEQYNFYVIELKSTLREETFINITITYTGNLNTEMRGFYRSSYDIQDKKRWLAATHLEPVAARRLFPCFDEPHLKATFNISVVAPENYHVLSNTNVKRIEKNIWEFETTPIMSTYLVAVVVSDFADKKFNDTDGKYKVWANPPVVNQSAYAVSVMKPIVTDFEKRFQVKYHFNKLDMVALPDFSSGAMENIGLITFRETNMLYDKHEMSSLVAKQSIRNVIAHEIAHQWFGNLVSPARWDYLWLSEGFARYFQYFQYTMDESSWNLEAQFVVDHLHKSLATDGLQSTHPITHKVYAPADIRALFDTISYAKAASIIRMLEKLVGSEKFYSALKRYLETFQFSVTEPSSLFSAFEKEAISNFDVKELLTNWTTQSGFPVINVYVKGNNVALTQTRFFIKPKSDPNKYASFTYLVPITYATDETPNFNDTKNVRMWFKEKSADLTIPNADKGWLIFNVQQTGFYRVNYDEAAWRRIFSVLDSDNFTCIHEINRAMIIDDLFNLARAYQLDYDILFAGVKYLRHETEYVPWKAAKTGFSYLAKRFAGRPTVYNAYRKYIIDLLQPNFEKLKFDDNENDKHTDILLRKLVLEWMCSLDEKKCIQKAKDLFKSQRNESDYEIPPNQKTFAYCTAIRHGNQDDWNYLKKKLEESNFATEKINILTALGCSKTKDNLKLLLNDVIKEGSYVRLQDAQKVFSYVIDGGLTGVETALDFIKENHDRMSKYFNGDSVTKSIISTLSKRLSTAKLIEKFESFIEYGSNKMPSIAKSLQIYLVNSLYEQKWYDDKFIQILKLMDMTVTNYRLPKSLTPTKYIIYVTPYFEERNFTFDGKVTIEINVQERTNRIVINMHKLGVIKITLNDTIIQLSNTQYNELTQQLFIYLKDEIVANTMVTLSFEYVGQLRHDMKGLYKSSYIDKNGNTKWIAATQFEPTYARSAFPCFDEPSFKAKFEINIAKPNGYHTLSNMGSNPMQEKDKKSDRVWDKYEETKMMSSYLVAFVVSDFVSETAENSNVTVWTREELKDYCTYASATGHLALKLLEEKLGVKYSMPEMNFVSVPDFDSGAMENWGLPTFREYGLAYDVNKISAAYRRYVNTVISHELVHMWFGNLVTLEWWDYTWLNEGFAQYLSHIISNESESTWKLLKQFVVTDLQIALDADSVESSHPMNNHVLRPKDIKEAFDKIAYKKSASVLRMFSNSFSEEVFFTVLQKYLEKNQYRNTRSEHLIEEFQNYYKTNNKSITGDPTENVTTIMQSWITQGGYPVIIAKRRGDRIEFYQERFLISSNNDSLRRQVYWTPVTYTTETENNFVGAKPRFWLGKDKKNVTIKSEDSWFVVNIEEVGYYRVNYDNDNWEQLVKVLNSDRYTLISELNRAQILDDTLNLARAGYIEYEIALNATKYLSRETNYYSWRAFFNSVAYLSQRIEGQPKIKDLFIQYILNLISNAYKTFGFKENTSKDDHLDQLTRELVLTYACKYGNEDCIKQSKEYFKNESITPNIAAAVYCTAIEHGNTNDWKYLWEKFLNSILASDYITILKSLGCSKDPTILERFLDHALDQDSKIRRQDFQTVVSSIYTSSQIGLETALKYFKNNAEKLHNYYENWSDVGGLFTSLAVHISTNKQIEDLRKSLHDEKLSHVKKSLESAVKTAQNNLEWFEKYSDKVYTWLKEQYKMKGPATSD